MHVKPLDTHQSTKSIKSTPRRKNSSYPFPKKKISTPTFSNRQKRKKEEKTGKIYSPLEINAKLVERGFYDTRATLTSGARSSELTAVDREDARGLRDSERVKTLARTYNASLYSNLVVHKELALLVPYSTGGRRFFNEATPRTFVLPLLVFPPSRLATE